MSSPIEAPSGEPKATPLQFTSPAPTSSQGSPPAPPPSQVSSPFPDYSPPPSPLSASAPSPAPPPPPSSATVRSPPPPPPSKTTRSPPPPPPPPSSKTAHSPPPPPSTILTSSSPSPPASKPSPSTTTPSSSSSASPPSSSSSSLSTISGGSLVAIGIAGVFAVSVLAILCYCLCRKKKKYYPGDYYNPHGGPPPHFKDSYYSANMRQQEWCSPSSEVLVKIPPLPTVSSMPSPRNGYDPIPPPPKGGGSPGLGNSKSWFTYQELAVATGGFASSNALGEGGFGCVYKGTLSSGQLVAVKQLKAGASQGEKEFRAEVEIISRVHHRHLVSLVGYCIADSQRLLVYDYVNNGTLEYHLHKNKEGSVLDWPTRLKIACGAARGLAYLHEDCHPRIIHRDIKSSNILLDDHFEAQVSDFGLAKLTSDTNTHVTTRVMGTFGYLAPEYASSGKLTEKSDVFSFGVVLLELATGRKPVDASQPAGDESLVEWARPILAQISSEEDMREIADPSLDGAFDPKEMMQMLEAAAACVRHSANKRPRMGQVVRALEDESSLSDLNKGFKPGHSGVFGSSFASTEYENGSYSADMRKYMRVALDTTQEFGSECSGATSEYGLNASASSGEYHTSREMDRNFSQQRPKPMSVRKNVHLYDTQEFRMGS